MNRKVLAILVVVILVAAGAVALFEINKNKDSADISIAVGTKNCYEPMWIAEEMGYYDQVGVKVKSNYVDGGGNASASVLAGASDLTLVGADPAIRMMEGGDAVLVATIEMASPEGSTNDFAYWDGLGIDLNNAKTLLNDDGTVKIVCGLDTTTGYYGGYMTYLKDQMDAGNITEEEFKLLRTINDGKNGGGIMHVPFDSQAVSLVEKKVQMICSGNTVAVAAEHEGIVTGSVQSSVVSGCYILASMDTYTNNYDNLVKVLKALDMACAYIQSPETRDAAAQFCADYYGASGWTAQTQKEFFNGYYWDICICNDVAQDLNTKAMLLGNKDMDYGTMMRSDACRDAHAGIELYGGKWLYDRNAGVLIDAPAEAI